MIVYQFVSTFVCTRVFRCRDTLSNDDSIIFTSGAADGKTTPNGGVDPVWRLD